MRIGTLVFTYHRSEHTKMVIDALAQNSLWPQKLYIFQDGVKDSTNYEEWRKVNEFIHTQHWCETEVHISERNKGLAKSIVSGINYVLQECDAVIILEDDCVPHRKFMQFMVSALNAYEKEKEVYSVSGYAWDVNLLEQEKDAYFNGRICSYGWGTWKDRWSQFEEDYYLLKKIKREPAANARLQIWGQDLAGMVTGNILDRCDSWAVFWALKVIEKGGYCLSPYKQLVQNVGFDGSGVHSGKLQASDTILEDEYKESFSFPEKVEIIRECEDEFRFLFAGKTGEEKMKLYRDMLIQWIQMRQEGKKLCIPDIWKDGIAVWGKGQIFDCFLNELMGKVQVKYIIESRPSTEDYKGIPIISIAELPCDVRTIVVIPYFDLDIIKIKARKIRPDIQLLGIDECLKYSYL